MIGEFVCPNADPRFADTIARVGPCLWFVGNRPGGGCPIYRVGSVRSLLQGILAQSPIFGTLAKSEC
jgi:hypothetical protein